MKEIAPPPVKTLSLRRTTVKDVVVRTGVKAGDPPFSGRPGNSTHCFLTC